MKAETLNEYRSIHLQKAGLDYETLKERYPTLVYAICTGYGEYGPDKDLPGFDFVSFLYQSTEDSSRERGERGEASGWSASAMESRKERYIPE